MAPESVPYDDVLYAVDLAAGRAAARDPTSVLTLVDGAMTRLAPMPYPGLLREARLAGTDAIDSARTGDFERSGAALSLLSHVVQDASRLEYESLISA